MFVNEIVINMLYASQNLKYEQRLMNFTSSRLVSHDNNELHTTVYRKPTHTDRLLDESSYNPTSHKATTIKTLTRRAQLVCDTTDSLSDENKYLDRVFYKNNYNADFVRREGCPILST